MCGFYVNSFRIFFVFIFAFINVGKEKMIDVKAHTAHQFYQFIFLFIFSRKQFFQVGRINSILDVCCFPNRKLVALFLSCCTEFRQTFLSQPEAFIAGLSENLVSDLLAGTPPMSKVSWKSENEIKVHCAFPSYYLTVKRSLKSTRSFICSNMFRFGE